MPSSDIVSGHTTVLAPTQYDGVVHQTIGTDGPFDSARVFYNGRVICNGRLGVGDRHQLPETRCKTAFCPTHHDDG